MGEGFCFLEPEKTYFKALPSNAQPFLGKVHHLEYSLTGHFCFEVHMAGNTWYATLQGEQLVFEEPSTKPPQGKRLKLVLVEEETDEDSMDNEERARLHAAIDQSMAQIANGQTKPASEVLARLKNRT